MHSQQGGWGENSSCLKSLSTFGIFSLFAVLVGVYLTHSGFNCVFLMANEVEHFKKYLLAIKHSFLTTRSTFCLYSLLRVCLDLQEL